MTVLLVEALVLRNPAVGRISSPYDLARIHPITKVKMPHLGTDVANVTGTPVRATAAGKVRGVATGHTNGDTTTNGVLPGRTGNCVLLAHDGWSTYYGHLSRVDVTPGQTVTPGQVIGLMGATGYVTGPHLHYEVHPTGGTTTTDPVPYMSARGITLGTDTEDDDMAQFTDEHARIIERLGSELGDFDKMQYQVGDVWNYRQRWIDTLAQVAALKAAIAQVNASGGTVDLAAVEAAARKGAADAIAAIEVKVVGA